MINHLIFITLSLSLNVISRSIYILDSLAIKRVTSVFVSLLVLASRVFLVMFFLIYIPRQLYKHTVSFFSASPIFSFTDYLHDVYHCLEHFTLSFSLKGCEETAKIALRPADKERVKIAFENLKSKLPDLIQSGKFSNNTTHAPSRLCKKFSF